jgi:hypothetical protein
MTRAKIICSAMGTLHCADDPFTQNLLVKVKMPDIGDKWYPSDERTVRNQPTASRQDLKSVYLNVGFLSYTHVAII